jgi:hypothetical protein
VAAPSMRRYYTWIAAIVVVCVLIVVAQGYLGQDTKYDIQSTKDLSTISYAVQNQITSTHSLPVSLDAIKTDVPKSRMTERGYQYRLLSGNNDRKFELCAVFRTSTVPKKTSEYDSRSYFNPAIHLKGRDCFQQKVYLPI